MAVRMDASSPTAGASTGSLLGLLGLDPLDSLEPAAREVARTRELAERAVFLAQRLLSRAGYRVSGYTDPVDALAAIRAEPSAYRLVVSDYSMPSMSGVDLARAIRATRADLPVVITTGYVTDELRRLADEVGVREIVYKPDSAAQLVGAVERLLREFDEAA